MRPRASRPAALQSVTVLEALEGLAAQHGPAGVPFKELETATRSRLDYRALTDALNALVNDGAVRRVTEKPARLAITEAGRKRLNEYRS
jgi:DNA-binding HxlR family transcriptional regulator